MACFTRVWHTDCLIIVFVLILAIDTSSPAGSLAVLRDEKVLGEISTNTDEAYSSRMFRHLEFLQRELSLQLEDFDLIAVAAGSGSFTGLRVGLAAAKGWSEVYRKSIAAVSALEAVAVQSRSEEQLLVPVLDARRGQVYFGFYSRQDHATANDLTLEGEECVATPEEFLEALRRRSGNSNSTIVTPAPEIFAKAISADSEPRAGLRIERASSVLAPFIGQIGYRQALRGQVSDSLTVDANYVRRSDAELNWKAPR
jgi:tRNA threonylcarbamoyl adenosine modification protein YeaZ